MSHVELLVYVVDETAMSVLALSCFPEDEDARCAVKRATDQLLRHRDPCGSYGGSPYTTALVVQVMTVI